MKDTVLTLLSLPATQRIDFSLGAAAVNPRFIARIVAAFAEDDIGIAYNATLGVEKAFYHPDRNELILGYRQIINSATVEALLLHECIHAGFDRDKTRLKVEQSEAAAYIAQVLYVYYLHQPEYDGGKESPFTHPITQAAWKLAIPRARTCFFLKDEDCKELYDAIKEEDLYKDRYGKTENYNGL